MRIDDPPVVSSTLSNIASLRPATRLCIAALAVFASSSPGCSSHCDVCKVDNGNGDFFPAGDHEPVSKPGKHVLEIVETRRIVPGPDLPESIEPMFSNNNLDVVRFDGRTFLAFRTAPSHYASADTRIVVVSSTDEKSWVEETTFQVGRDLREPRFLPVAGKLFLYVTELGVDDDDFQPGGIKVSERAAGGKFNALRPLFTDGRLLWRTFVHDGKSYATWYTGGEQIYRPIVLLSRDKLNGFLELLLPTPLFEGSVKVHLGTTDDGVTFNPVASPMHVGGASETAVAFDPSGNGYAVMRTELPEPGGHAGSNVCRAEASDLSKWSCRHDTRKFDSPFMFEHDGEIYLVARRNLAQNGEFAPDPITTVADYVLAQAKYSCSRKRCAVWRFDKEHQAIDFVMDLPSRGDTCFPSVIPGERPDEVVIYDYSAPLNDTEEQRWCEAQDDVTHIYRHQIRFVPNDGAHAQRGAFEPALAGGGRSCAR
ncbi:MAG: hypothetical protein HOW73_18495 [Polyangiaceae bacterium]|nr:hypothetical protein [Polyangiaceae bacterium]